MALVFVLCCEGSCCTCCRGLGATTLETGTAPTSGWDICRRFWMPKTRPSPLALVWTLTVELVALIPLYFAWPTEDDDNGITCSNGILFYRGVVGFLVLNIVFVVVMRIRQHRLFKLSCSEDDVLLAQRMRVFLMDAPTIYTFVWLFFLQTLWLAARDFIIGSKERNFNICTGAVHTPSVTILVFQWLFIIGSSFAFVVSLVVQMSREGDKVSRMHGRSDNPGTAPMGSVTFQPTPFDGDDLDDELLRGGPNRSPADGLAQLEAAVSRNNNRSNNNSSSISSRPPLSSSPGATATSAMNPLRQSPQPQSGTARPPSRSNVAVEQRQTLESSKVIEW